jgi:GNAT superfamily N-acetyltransferase
MSNCPDLLDIKIVPFDRSISRQEFFSGQPDLDYWLRTFAGQNENRFRTRTFYALENEMGPLLGYYTSVFGEVVASPAVGGMGSSKYSRPALLIARLALDHAFQNCGIGSLLVKSALTHALEASEVAGLELVIVDVIEDAAVSFYSRFGFAKFDQESKRMFLTMKELRASK